MKVTRENDIATMVVETDSEINEDAIDQIDKLNETIYIKGINPIKR